MIHAIVAVSLSPSRPQTRLVALARAQRFPIWWRSPAGWSPVGWYASEVLNSAIENRPACVSAFEARPPYRRTHDSWSLRGRLAARAALKPAWIRHPQVPYALRPRSAGRATFKVARTPLLSRLRSRASLGRALRARDALSGGREPVLRRLRRCDPASSSLQRAA